MPNTYTQVHIQFVFAVKFRHGTIQPQWKDELYKYITSIIQANKHKMLAVNGMPDHVHVLVGLRPSQTMSDLMQDVKASSSQWVNDKKLVAGRFEWQEGYGAFSYSKNQISAVIDYIEQQEKHHAKKTFLQEYKEFLEIFGIDYDERYLFKELI